MAKKPADDSDETGASETGSQAGSGSQASSGSEVSGGSSDDTEAASSPPAKPSGKTGKTSAVKPAAKATSQRPTATAAPRPRGSGHELVPVICCECYEELVFDSGVPSPVLTCPVCEHQAARPDDAQLAIIAEKRKQEKMNFIISLALALLSLAFFVAWIAFLRDPSVEPEKNGPKFYGPLVGAILMFLGCAGFGLGKYEGSRHDVYF